MGRQRIETARSVTDAEAQRLEVPALDRWFEFAHTLDGYRIAEELGIDIAELARQMRSEYADSGRWLGTRLELRVMLFSRARDPVRWWSRG